MMTKNNNLHNEDTMGTRTDLDTITGKRSLEEFTNYNSENLIKFCETHGIRYIPIILKIKSQFEGGIEKKIKILQKDFFRVLPKPNDFDLQPELVARRVARFKQRPHEYTHIAMDTRDIHQIDIDCPECTSVDHGI